MLRRKHSLSVALLVCCVVCQVSVRAQSSEQNISNLTIYNAGIAEFLEERTLELQQGYNTIVWRSLMPRANIRTVRVIADDAEVVRVDVTYDGPQVNEVKSPVLHLVIQNRGASARTKSGRPGPLAARRVGVEPGAARVAARAEHGGRPRAPAPQRRPRPRARRDEPRGGGAAGRALTRALTPS